MSPFSREVATIPSGGTKSNAFDLGPYKLVQILMPAAFTGTALSFEVSDDEAGTFRVLYQDATAVSITVAASRAVGVDAAAVALGAGRWVKCVSNDTEAADRSLIVLLKV